MKSTVQNASSPLQSSENKCKCKELVYKAKYGKWREKQEASEHNAIVLFVAFKEKYCYHCEQ